MGTFNAVQLSWALSMQCSSHGHFQCSAALMGTFNAVQLSWALSMQCSSHGYFQCSAALRALSMQCSAQGTFNAVQLSWVYFVMEYMQPLCCILQYNSHRALTHLSKWHCMKLLWGTSQCNSHRALTPQQVALHEALVGHFTVQLSQSTDASASGTA